MRLFGGERISSMMNSLGIDDDTPIENRMVSNSIESAQRRVEGRNFSIRKNVLNYDDVMNRQREIIYSQRDQVLNGEDIHDVIIKMMDEFAETAVDQFVNEETAQDNWNLVGLRDSLLGYLTTEEDFSYSVAELSELERVDPVSYTHLDVYKRQAKEPGFS